MVTLCCDVGSASLRVAILQFSSDDKLNSAPLAVSTRPLNIYNRKPDYYEQKTQEIWLAFCQATNECLANLNKNPPSDQIIDSIGFTGTCSLVIVGDSSPEDDCDVIMWMDHRAKREAFLINQSQCSVLQQFGGICSPEFSLAKLVWLAKNQPGRFNLAKGFMELPDWLSYRCSQWFSDDKPEEFPRSLCSVVCKWGYDALKNQWPEDVFQHLGLNLESFVKKIGINVRKPGVSVGYLNPISAQEMGFKTPLVNSVVIASSLIDAHAGAISMLTFSKSSSLNPSIKNANIDNPYENILCLISGTSTCHMILNKMRLFTHGIWGPYPDAIIPNHYLREAGQSATGKLIEHIICSYNKMKVFDKKQFIGIVNDLNNQLSRNNLNHHTNLIVNPTFHGNRSPLANPDLKGAIYGMTLEDYSLLDIYVATIEAIAYETKFIVKEIEKNSHSIRKIIVSGGLTKNDFYLQIHADVLGKKLLVYDLGDVDHMLTGASIIAYTASKIGEEHSELINSFNKITIDVYNNQVKSKIFKPRIENNEYHHKKYKCYRKLLDCCVQIENIMKEPN